MMKGAKKNILDAIGWTPIVKLNKVTTGVDSEIYVKLEYMNPGGSSKDRIGGFIMDRAVAAGKLKPGGTIIEGTSGNTGVGLAMWAAVNGYKCIFVLADKQSQEKVNNLKSFGAKVVVCPTDVEPDDPRSYYSVSKRLAETIPNSYYVNQYDNLWNRETHVATTGPEIFEQTQGDFDVYMAGVGTGGTITGVSMYLKTKMPNLKTVGVDVEGSIVAQFARTGDLSGARSYVIEGIGEDFIPENYDFKVIDDWVVVGDKESFLMTRALLKQEGIYTGGSGGAAVVGAIKYAKTLKEPKKILVILPDSGNRYTSKIYNDEWMMAKGYIDSAFNVQIKDLLVELNKDHKPLISITDHATIGDAIKLMEEKSVSQVPVIQGDIIKGIISEQSLLKPLYNGEYKFTDSVSLAYNKSYRTVDIHELLASVQDSLLKKEVVLVTENGKLKNILSNIDILNFIAKRDNA
ncbi:MAG: pyridoxal-phosphate dependent enzyme [Bacteriovoracaceae bacterium]|nr:pyridoxal-phosphate dependent enzyme [Bacteriovoracaceae bacterium]